MPAGAGAEGVEAGDLIMIGQQTEGMAAEGVADHEQRAFGMPMLIHRGGQVEVSPVQVVHLETAQAGRSGLADAAVVQGQGVETATGRMLGEAPIEPLWHPGGAGDQQLRAGSLGEVARGSQGIIVEGEQRLGFAADGRIHGMDSVRCRCV